MDRNLKEQLLSNGIVLVWTIGGVLGLIAGIVETIIKAN